MKHYPPPSPPARPKPRRPPIPSFHPVPLRHRKDGWTAERQAQFIGYLAQMRSVSGAAKAVGMARETAYRLRRHGWAEGFCAAWDAAMARPGRKRIHTPPPKTKVTSAELRWRVGMGLVRPVMVHGRFTRVARRPDHTALLQLLQRLDTAASGIARYHDGREWSQSLEAG